MRNIFTPYTQVRTLLASIIGTSAMTFYSYLVSWGTDKNFKEPKLLGQLAERFISGKSNDNKITGWGMHYLMGLLFAETYAPFWSLKENERNEKTGLVLGGISGIAAILLWKFTFTLHPDPPPIHFIRFAGQLFIAHLLFGLATALAFDLSKYVIPRQVKSTSHH